MGFIKPPFFHGLYLLGSEVTLGCAFWTRTFQVPKTWNALCRRTQRQVGLFRPGEAKKSPLGLWKIWWNPIEEVCHKEYQHVRRFLDLVMLTQSKWIPDVWKKCAKMYQVWQVSIEIPITKDPRHQGCIHTPENHLSCPGSSDPFGRHHQISKWWRKGLVHGIHVGKTMKHHNFGNFGMSGILWCITTACEWWK